MNRLKGERKAKNQAYLRVSTADQGTEKFKSSILKFANDRDFGRVKFVEDKVSGKKSWKERKIAGIIEELKKGDRLIVPELSRLGRSTLEVLEILKEAKGKEINVYSVKEGFEMNGTMQAKIMATLLSLFSELERDFISQRTKEGLKAARAKGKLLGRPKGPGKSKLDPYREEIISLLKNGSTKMFVAKRYGCTQVNLYNWLKKNKIKVAPDYKRPTK